MVETAYDVYDRILKKLQFILNPGQTEYEIMIAPKKHYDLDGLKFGKVLIQLTLFPDKENSEYRLSDMGNINTFSVKQINKKLRLSPVADNTARITINLDVPVDWDKEGVINYFKSEESELRSSIAHELTHRYSNLKTPSRELRKVIEYQVNKDMMGMFGIIPIRNLLYYLYYFDKTENIVRPAELFAKVKSNNITKSQFKDYLLKEYPIFKKMKNFTVDNLKNELKDNIDQVTHVLNVVLDPENVSRMSDEEKIIEILNIVWVNFVNRVSDQYFTSLKDHLPSMSKFALAARLPGSEEIINDVNSEMTRVIKKSKRGGSIEDYLRWVERYLNTMGDKMIRKLAKIYQLVKDDPEE